MNGGTFSPAVEDLDRYVLVIQESPNGHVTQSRRPVDELDLSQFRFQPRAEREYGRIVFAAAGQRDCHAEYLDCFNECMRAPLIRGAYGHIKGPGRSRDGKGAKEEMCNKKCLRYLKDCEDAQERRLQEFSTTEKAIDWLSQNRNEVLWGSIVIAAGVAFWVFPPTAIAGGVIAAARVLFVLVPMTALVSSEAVCKPHGRMVAVAP